MELSTENEQHEFITAGLGFLIHPAIEKALSFDAYTRPDEIRIADVARGEQFSDGARLAPSLNQARRTRIEFGGSIATGKMKDDLRGQFDIVAVRLLHTRLRPDKWDETLEDLVALLKPGGWLQWVDWDPMTARVATVKPGAPDSVLRDVLFRFTDALRAQKTGSTYKISTAMRLRLTNEDSDHYTVTPSEEFTRNVVSSALLYLERSGAIDAKEASDLRAKVLEEIRTAGSLIYYDLWCHIAMKPK